MTEEQAPYEAGTAQSALQPADQPATTRSDFITVKISAQSVGARHRFAELVAHILTGSQMQPDRDAIEVFGTMDESTTRFLAQLEQKDGRIRELVAQNHDLADDLALRHEQFADCEGRRQKLVLELEAEQAVCKALESRIADVASRKLALQVAHGDVAPDQYEARRKIEVNGVRDFVGAVRAQLQLPRAMAPTGSARR